MKKIVTQQGMILAVVALLMIVVVPHVTFAVGPTNSLATLVALILTYFNGAIKFIIGLAILTFVWNVYNYYFKADADRTEAGQYVLYSVIGFFVMLSMWGLVNLLTGTFKFDNTQPTLPYINFGGATGGGTSAGQASGNSIYGGSPNVQSPVGSGSANGLSPVGSGSAGGVNPVGSGGANGVIPVGSGGNAAGTNRAGAGSNDAPSCSGEGC